MLPLNFIDSCEPSLLLAVIDAYPIDTLPMKEKESIEGMQYTLREMIYDLFPA